MLPGNSHGDTLVYSDPSARPPADAQPTSAPTSRSDTVRIWLEKKGRNGKPVCIVRGLTMNETALAALAARLKRACGTGGTAKDGEIIIQGDHRDAIASLLTRDGFRVKKAGG
jgi:translation initiation factor 1